MPTPNKLTCSECGREAIRTAKNQVTCGRSHCHNARTARLAREKKKARKRGPYLIGPGFALARPDTRTKCHTKGCTTLTSDYWCSECQRKRCGFSDTNHGPSPIDECPFL